MYEGRLDEAAGVIALLYDGAVRLAEPSSLGWAATFVGAVAFLQGDLERAGAHLAEAEAAFLEALLPGTARWAVAVGVLTAHARGDAAGAAAGRRRREGYRIDGFGLFTPLERLGDAWAALGDGRTDKARRLAVAAVDEAVAVGAWSHAAHAAHDLARFGHWADAAAALDRLPAPGSALTRARREFVRTGAADDGPGLDAAAAAFEALGARLFAAEASACAAAAHRRAGRSRSATASAARMSALLASCPGASTPPLRLSGGADLTAREEEVATMAATGHTNRAIAGELGISERTVENHLYRAFAKLGVTSRGDLAPALGARAVRAPSRT
jgi:DNA-binding CsgD family transcriptional regulator